MFFNFGPSPDPMTIHPPRRRAFGCRLVSLTAAGLLCVSTVHADQRIPLTIAEAEDLALSDEPGLSELRAFADALNEQSIAAGQLPDPVLRVGLSNYPIQGGNFSTEGMTQAQLGIRQAFPRGRLRSMSTANYRALASVQMENAETRARSVLAATRIAWLESYYWQRAGQVLDESRSLFDDLLQVTRSMYAVGRKTQSDVLRAELELRRIDDRLIETSRSRSVAQGALSQWLGADAYRPAANKLPAWKQLPSLETLRETLAGHPSMRAADAQIDARQAKIGIAEEQGKPGWALDLGYGYRDGFLASGEPRSDFVSLSVVIDLPIFKRNRQDRDLGAALSARRAAISGKHRLRADLESKLAIEYAQWTELSRRLALYESDILDLSASRAEAAMLAYQSDSGDFSEVMLGQIDQLNTRLEHIRLQVERAQSYAALANLGGIPR